MEFLVNVLVSALVIAAVSEIGRRSTPVAALLASLPLTSILAITSLYLRTGDGARVRDLSLGIFWAVLPSLLFFLVLYALLKLEVRFWFSLLCSCVTMAAAYGLYLSVLKKFGISL